MFPSTFLYRMRRIEENAMEYVRFKQLTFPSVSLFRIYGNTADSSGNESPRSINVSKFLVQFVKCKLKTMLYHARCLLLTIVQSEHIFPYSGKPLRTELSYPSFPYKLTIQENFVQRMTSSLRVQCCYLIIYFRILWHYTQLVYCPAPPFVYTI